MLLLGCMPQGKHTYEIHTYTGFKKDSETDSKVYVLLNGTNKNSGIKLLSDGVAKVFRSMISKLSPSFLLSTLFGIQVIQVFAISSNDNMNFVLQTFGNGEVNTFILTTPYHFGHLYSLKIWHDNSGKGKKASWFLSKVVVVDVSDESWYD